MQMGPGQGLIDDAKLRRLVEGRLLGLRVNRYSWWTHARELADYLLPRRYRWLVTPNMMARGSPINQHIIDSTGTLAARNLASGMMSGISSPTRRYQTSSPMRDFWYLLAYAALVQAQSRPDRFDSD